MSTGELIKRLRVSHGLTQKELAKRLNLAPTAISAWERDANKPMMDKLSIMSKMFNVPISDFYIDTVKEPSNLIKISQRTVKIPILGKIACGDPILAEQNYEDYRTVLEEGLPSGTLVYLEAKGDSMHPTIPNGALVMIREQPEVENGEIAAVLINGNSEATLKRVKKQGEIILLMPDNPKHDPIIVGEDNPIKIIGKAMKFERDL